jgi:hypothetical protein
VSLSDWKSRLLDRHSRGRRRNAGGKTVRPSGRQLPAFELLERRAMFAMAFDYLDPIGWTALQTQLGAAMPTGAGITVSQVEHLEMGAGGYIPASYDPALAGKTFTIESGPSVASQHATNVAEHLYGSAGVAPGVTQIDNWEVTNWSSTLLNDGTSLPPAVETQEIENNSWDGGSAGANGDLETLQRFDYMINRDNVVATVAIGNEGNNLVPHLLASNYNGITVGLSNGTANYGLTTIDGSGRTKPDIVAPEQTSSLATPQVAGTAALLLDEVDNSNWSAAKKADGRNELAIKAILLAGATKDQFPDWSQTPQQPLDPTYGAGQLSVYNSYYIMAAGEQSAGTVGASGWGLAKTGAPGTDQTYTFTVPAGTTLGEVSVALTWNAVVTSTATTGFGNLQTSLANLDMYINRVQGSQTTPIDSSVSTVDNVEYLYLKNLGPGTYEVQVTGNQAQVPYALAWDSLDVSATPSIELLGAGTQIPQGESSPSPANGTDFGNVALDGSPQIETFTIQNSGQATLNLTGTPIVSSSNPADFSIVSQPAASSLMPGASTTFKVQFAPAQSALRSATLTIASNDSHNDPFTFAVSGVGTAQPQIAVTGGSKPIADGATTTSAANDTAYGSTAVQGTPATETYTISNSGTGALTVGNVMIGGTNAADFTVTSQPGSSVAVGGSTTFTVQFAPSAAGSRKATVTFNENDPTTASPFNFAISGVGTTQSQIGVTGNSQPITDGATSTSTKNDTAFGSTLVASPISETYTIANSGTGVLTVGSVTIGGTNPADFTVTSQPSASVAVGGNTTFTVQFIPSAAGSRKATVSFSENDPTTNSPFTFAISGVGTTQSQIGVTGNSLPISDGATSTSATNDTAFGSTLVAGSPISETYTIVNTGTAALTVGTVTIGGTNPADFAVTSQPSASVAAGSSTTFTVQFAPTAAGSRKATVNFSENDPTTSSPFTFAISGQGTPGLSIADTQVVVPDDPSQTVNALFKVNLSAAAAMSVTVVFATVDGTAVAGQDYQANSGTLTFSPGTLSQSITVVVNGTLFANPTKQFTVQLSQPGGAGIIDSTGTCSIVNNNVAAWSNPIDSNDVNADGIVSPLDSLQVINYLNSNGPGLLPTPPSGQHPFLDTNHDGSVSSIDALLVLNQLNMSSSAVAVQTGSPSPAVSTAALSTTAPAAVSKTTSPPQLDALAMAVYGSEDLAGKGTAGRRPGA